MLRPAGGRKTLLHPENANKATPRAVPPTPPLYVAVLMSPKTELSFESGNQDARNLERVGQQGPKKPPVKERNMQSCSGPSA